MLAAVLPVLAVAAFLCWRLVKASSLYARGMKQGFPTPRPPTFIVGHLNEIWGDEVALFKIMKKFAEQFGSRCVVKIVHQCSMFIVDAEAIEAVMTSSKHITKGPLYNPLLPWLGRGLLTNYGSSWHRRRKLLTPAFHFKILDEFGPMLAQDAKNLVQDLHDLSQSTKDAVDVVRPVSIITLRSISGE